MSNNITPIPERIRAAIKSTDDKSVDEADYMLDSDDCIRIVREQFAQPDQQPQAEKRCQYCDGTGDVHSIDGQWRGACQCQKQPQAVTPQASTIEDAARDVGKWLNERPNRPIDLRHVAMLVTHAQQPQAETEMRPADKHDMAVYRAIAEGYHADKQPQAGQYQGDDSIAIPRSLIAAACGAIRLKHDAPKLLAELRRYTVGDWSRALTQQPQAEAVPSDVVRDAERYRFIRDNCDRRINIEIDNAGVEISDTVDTAIDAAMAQGEKP